MTEKDPKVSIEERQKKERLKYEVAQEMGLSGMVEFDEEEVQENMVPGKTSGKG